MLSRLFKRLFARFKEWAFVDEAAILAEQVRQTELEAEERRQRAESEESKRHLQEAIYKKQREMKDAMRTSKD